MKVGDSYVIEIAEVQTYTDDNGRQFDLGRVKGFRALTLDESALKKLEKMAVVQEKRCPTRAEEGDWICSSCQSTDCQWK